MLIVLKKNFKQNKMQLFLKMSIFCILTASKNIKILKVKFEVGFSYKYCK